MEGKTSSPWAKHTARSSTAPTCSTFIHLIHKSAWWTYRLKSLWKAMFNFCLTKWNWWLTQNLHNIFCSHGVLITMILVKEHIKLIKLIIYVSFHLLFSTCLLVSPSDGLKMEIVFKRRLTNELLTTYLPSLLLLLMSYATSYFKSFYFEAAVTVNLSILLVTTTLFIRWDKKIFLDAKHLYR